MSSDVLLQKTNQFIKRSTTINESLYHIDKSKFIQVLHDNLYELITFKSMCELIYLIKPDLPNDIINKINNHYNIILLDETVYNKTLEYKSPISSIYTVVTKKSNNTFKLLKSYSNNSIEAQHLYANTLGFKNQFQLKIKNITQLSTKNIIQIINTLIHKTDSMAPSDKLVPYTSVLSDCLNHISQLYNVTITEINSEKLWNTNVSKYSITIDEKILGFFYIDPLSQKESTCFCFHYKATYPYELGKKKVPHIVIFTNNKQTLSPPDISELYYLFGKMFYHVGFGSLFYNQIDCETYASLFELESHRKYNIKYQIYPYFRKICAYCIYDIYQYSYDKLYKLSKAANIDITEIINCIHEQITSKLYPINTVKDLYVAILFGKIYAHNNTLPKNITSPFTVCDNFSFDNFYEYYNINNSFESINCDESYITNFTENFDW